jgi:hypothetical protein
MTIEEGRDLIVQMDIDAQVVAELSKSSDQEISARPRERCCGRYGKTGHNAKTCQEGIQAFGDEYSN